MKDLIDRQAAIDVVLELDASRRVSWKDAVIDTIDALPSAQPKWIPVSERLPDEDYMTGKGVQYSASVLVTIVNHGNDDERSVDVACTADGVWRLTYPTDSPCIPRWCEVLAWMPLPEPARLERD